MPLKGFKYNLLSTYCRPYIKFGGCNTEYPWCNKESFFLDGKSDKVRKKWER